MTDVSGIPNMGFGGGAYYGGSGLNNAYANQAQTNQYLAQQQAQMAAANSYNPWANSGGSFGVQPAAYAYAGAAYGRAVPASSPAAVAAQNPSASVFDTGAAPFNHYGGVGGLQLFDPNKYLSQNKDVWEAGADPWQHYNQFGKNEGRAGAWGDFNSAGYLAANPDVAAAGVDPTAHWFQYGQKEGREGSGFTPWLGASAAPAQQPAQQTARDWNSGRDAITAAYLTANRDVFDAAKASGRDPNAFGLEHLTNYGQDENRQFFDANEYLRENPDVFAAGANPFQHYQQYGQKEGRAAPTGQFHPWEYYIANPDVANAGADAFQHYVDYGQKEGRAGGWEWSSRNRSSPWPARMEATPAMEGDDPRLAAQRQDYANSVRNDAEKRILFAARLHSELGNDPAGRTAITEAMLNRRAARGLDPLDPRYYPQDAASVRHYNESLALMRSNPNMFNTVMQDAERAFGGSNYSNYATDWASQVKGMTVAERARVNATPTWTSPINEEFFRRDRTGTDTGDPAARQIQNWYNSLASPFPR